MKRLLSPQKDPEHLKPSVVTQRIPVYSGKQRVRGDFLIFSSNKSFLLRNRIMDVSVNHLLLQIESNNFMLSIIRFCNTLNVKGQRSSIVLLLMDWNPITCHMGSHSVTCHPTQANTPHPRASQPRQAGTRFILPRRDVRLS